MHYLATISEQDEAYSITYLLVTIIFIIIWRSSNYVYFGEFGQIRSSVTIYLKQVEWLLYLLNSLFLVAQHCVFLGIWGIFCVMSICLLYGYSYPRLIYFALFHFHNNNTTTILDFVHSQSAFNLILFKGNMSRRTFWLISTLDSL